MALYIHYLYLLGKIGQRQYPPRMTPRPRQEVMKFEKEILGMRGMTRQDMAEVVELVNQRKIVPYVYKTVPFEQINEALGLLRDGKTKGRVVLLFPED